MEFNLKRFEIAYLKFVINVLKIGKHLLGKTKGY